MKLTLTEARRYFDAANAAIRRRQSEVGIVEWDELGAYLQETTRASIGAIVDMAREHAEAESAALLDAARAMCLGWGIEKVRERFFAAVDAAERGIGGVALLDRLRAAEEERDEWRNLASTLRVAEARASGALCDAGSVPTDPLEDGIRALTTERDDLRRALATERAAFLGERGARRVAVERVTFLEAAIAKHRDQRCDGNGAEAEQAEARPPPLGAALGAAPRAARELVCRRCRAVLGSHNTTGYHPKCAPGVAPDLPACVVCGRPVTPRQRSTVGGVDAPATHKKCQPYARGG